jgi:hypothetical protein
MTTQSIHDLPSEQVLKQVLGLKEGESVLFDNGNNNTVTFTRYPFHHQIVEWHWDVFQSLCIPVTGIVGEDECELMKEILSLKSHI